MRFRDTPAMATVRKLLEHKEARAYIEPRVPKRLHYGYTMAEVLEYLDEKQPAIAECQLGSIVRAVARWAEWDLRLGTGAYLIPRRVEGARKPRLVAMQSYIGKVEILVRHRMVTFVNASSVFENEKFEYEQGTNPDIKHLPLTIKPRAEWGPLIGAYAWTLDPRSRVKRIVVMSREDIDGIRQEFSEQWRDVDLETIAHWYPVARCVHRLAKMIPATTDAALSLLSDDVDDGEWRRPVDWSKAA